MLVNGLNYPYCRKTIKCLELCHGCFVTFIFKIRSALVNYMKTGPIKSDIVWQVKQTTTIKSITNCIRALGNNDANRILMGYVFREKHYRKTESVLFYEDKRLY